MKIAIAHYSSSADIGGVTTWLLGFCEHLVQDDHEVVMHLHHFGDNPQQGSILPSLDRLGIETHSVSRTGSVEADTRQTLQFLNQVQPDLFMPQCRHVHYIAAAHAGRQGLPWIFTMHSDDPEYWCVAESLTPELNGGSTVCVSNYIAQKVRLQVPFSFPKVIPYGIRISAGRAGYSEQPFRVVFSGRMVRRQKCIQLVLQTLIHACRASTQIEAHLIGDGPDRSACEQLVLEAGFEERIHFHGRVSPDQVLPILQQSQAILLMSEFEGLPVALLEAMSLGVVPVVRAIKSGVPELIFHESTGLLVSDNPVEAAAELVRLSCDHILWNKCSSRARKLVVHSYSYDQALVDWSQYLNDLKLPVHISYPIRTCKFKKLIPLHDRRFLAQVSQPTRVSLLVYVRRMASALIRRILMFRQNHLGFR